MKIVRFLVVFVLGGLAGIFIGYFGGQDNVVLNFTVWRAGRFMDRGVVVLILNNVFVLSAVLYGGVFFALLELESYERFPSRVYGFLDKTVRWMHYLFSLFDNRIGGMKNPMKSCYFITVSFPIVVVFVNSMLYFNLIAYGFLVYGINAKTIGVLVETSPVAFIEFTGIIVVASAAYRFTQENLVLYERNDYAGYGRKAREYLKSWKNMCLLAAASIAIAGAGFIEHSLL
jgi:hypothetical protein